MPLFARRFIVTTEQLEADLKLADCNAEKMLRVLVGLPHCTPERTVLDQRYDDLLKASAELRRQLAILTGDEHAIRLDFGVRPECAVSGPVLIQTDRHCMLLFNAQRKTVGLQVPQAVVTFDRVLKSKCGLPNDEALDSHPLSKRGLEAYDIFEVLNSRWLAEEQSRNQVRFPNFTFDCRHFIFTFHDSSFECLAKDMSFALDIRPFAEIWRDLFDRVNEA
jgi:hypothetical protein